MKFLADMGVSDGVITWLRSENHDVVGVRELGMERASDVEIFRFAESQRRVILTFDLDFGEILALSGGKSVSVILFRINDTTTPFVIKRLAFVLADAKTSLETGAIVVVEDGRHRIRALPLGT